ncbi:MAG: redoxin domain-containing protein [Gemmatimonadetes bacterium]|nr:redoxin domain-containing protein [Gemmatimonadota bacterium]
MTARRQWMMVGAIVALLAVGAWGASRIIGDELVDVGVGVPAPGFTAMTVDRPATARTLSDYRGQVVVLNLWATWCVPCRTEMPSMEALYKDLGPRGLKVVAVSVDEAGMEDRIREFRTEFGLTFEILHDAAGVMQGIYRTTGIPETFVIGKDGVIRKKWVGADDWNSPGNRRMLEQLLAEPSS